MNIQIKKNSWNFLKFWSIQHNHNIASKFLKKGPESFYVQFFFSIIFKCLSIIKNLHSLNIEIILLKTKLLNISIKKPVEFFGNMDEKTY